MSVSHPMGQPPSGRSALRILGPWALLVFCGAVHPLAQHLTGLGEEQIARILVWPIYLIVASMAIAKAGDVARAARENVLAMLFTVYLSLTWTWSVAPDVSLRRGAAMVMTTLLGLLIASQLDERERLQVVCVALATAAVLSLVCALVVPAVGISGRPHDGLWRGAFAHKNVLGRAMVTSTCAHLVLARDSSGRRWLAYAGAALSLCLVVLSGSTSALIFGLLTAISLPFLGALQSRTNTLLLSLGAVMLISAASAATAFIDRDVVLAALGKDETLSGRTELWLVAMSMLRARFWLGAGLGAFWGSIGGPSAEVQQAVGWAAPNSHNGALDIALDLGVIGLSLFCVGVLVALLRAARTAIRVSTSITLWPFAFLLLLLLSEMTESAVLLQNSFLWAAYLAATCGSRCPAPRTVDEPVEDVAPPRGGLLIAGARGLSSGVSARLRRTGASR